ncbi:MAG: hypothetical protein Q4A06_03915 [Cardiobacteriaceae bacterium]|nr:hypothetical protein [Cardiobacteriaceae bacterium]
MMQLIWQEHPQEVTRAWRTLMQTQSLTAALKATGADFAVRVRHQGALETAWEADAGGRLYAREVHLLLDGAPVVWARSVCAVDATGWRKVLDCGEQPLGARLFGGDVQAARSPFRYALTRAGQVPETDAPVWMRQSHFDGHGELLILSEAFLPGLSRYF